MRLAADRRSRAPLLLPLVLVALATITRLPQLLSPLTVADADECILGLMAKHLLETGRTTLFFYGQNYGLSIVETGAAAIAFAVAGVSAGALKAAMLALWIVGLAPEEDEAQPPENHPFREAAPVGAVGELEPIEGIYRCALEAAPDVGPPLPEVPRFRPYSLAVYVAIIPLIASMSLDAAASWAIGVSFALMFGEVVYVLALLSTTRRR